MSAAHGSKFTAAAESSAAGRDDEAGASNDCRRSRILLGRDLRASAGDGGLGRGPNRGLVYSPAKRAGLVPLLGELNQWDERNSPRESTAHPREHERHAQPPVWLR